MFILIQFYRPNKNSSVSEIIRESDFLSIYKASDEVKNIFINCCYDCHSNHTNYYWYDNIMPVGWWIDNNIKKGKASLNFSIWMEYSSYRKLSHLSAMEFDISINRMPTKEYLYLHKESRLTKYRKEVLINWIKTIDRNKIFENKRTK